jgi:hypothetical protein
MLDLKLVQLSGAKLGVLEREYWRPGNKTTCRSTYSHKEITITNQDQPWHRVWSACRVLRYIEKVKQSFIAATECTYMGLTMLGRLKYIQLRHFTRPCLCWGWDCCSYEHERSNMWGTPVACCTSLPILSIIWYFWTTRDLQADGSWRRKDAET